MASYVKSTSTNTRQVLVGPGDSAAIEIEGGYYAVDFISNGGPMKGTIGDFKITLENFHSQIGAAMQFQVPIGSATKKLNIMCHAVGEGDAAYRLIAWSVY